MLVNLYAITGEYCAVKVLIISNIFIKYKNASDC